MNSATIISNNGILTELKETGSTKEETSIQYYTKYSCPVCYNSYEKPILTRECKHVLCIPCFEQLPQKKCPICREEPISITKLDDS